MWCCKGLTLAADKQAEEGWLAGCQWFVGHQSKSWVPKHSTSTGIGFWWFLPSHTITMKRGCAAALKHLNFFCQRQKADVSMGSSARHNLQGNWNAMWNYKSLPPLCLALEERSAGTAVTHLNLTSRPYQYNCVCVWWGGGWKGEILLPHLLGELVGSFARCVQHSVVNRLGGFGDMTVKALNCNL